LEILNLWQKLPANPTDEKVRWNIAIPQSFCGPVMRNFSEQDDSMFAGEGHG
jgi:hypothetical protein